MIYFGSFIGKTTANANMVEIFRQAEIAKNPSSKLVSDPLVVKGMLIKTNMCPKRDQLGNWKKYTVNGIDIKDTDLEFNSAYDIYSIVFPEVADLTCYYTWEE